MILKEPSRCQSIGPIIAQPIAKGHRVAPSKYEIENL